MSDRILFAAIGLEGEGLSVIVRGSFKRLSVGQGREGGEDGGEEDREDGGVGGDTEAVGGGEALLAGRSWSSSTQKSSKIPMLVVGCYRKL